MARALFSLVGESLSRCGRSENVEQWENLIEQKVLRKGKSFQDFLVHLSSFQLWIMKFSLFLTIFVISTNVTNFCAQNLRALNLKWVHQVKLTIFALGFATVVEQTVKSITNSYKCFHWRCRKLFCGNLVATPISPEQLQAAAGVKRDGNFTIFFFIYSAIFQIFRKFSLSVFSLHISCVALNSIRLPQLIY